MLSLLSGGPSLSLGRLSSVLCPAGGRWIHSQLSTCLPLYAGFDDFSFGSLVPNAVLFLDVIYTFKQVYFFPEPEGILFGGMSLFVY